MSRFLPIIMLAALVAGSHAAGQPSLNVTCFSGTTPPPSTDTGGEFTGCVMFDKAESIYQWAGPDVTLYFGDDWGGVDIVHLMPGAGAASAGYAAPRWCFSPKSHFTASGNLVINYGGPGEACDAQSMDLDKGDCHTTTEVAGESLQVCFNGLSTATNNSATAKHRVHR